jgi:hypothetical protein
MKDLSRSCVAREILFLGAQTEVCANQSHLFTMRLAMGAGDKRGHDVSCPYSR